MRRGLAGGGFDANQRARNLFFAGVGVTRLILKNLRLLTSSPATQCWWQPPPQQCPPPDFLPGEFSPVPAEANVENFLASFFEPQCGHSAAFQSIERTRISLSRSHRSQWNS